MLTLNALLGQLCIAHWLPPEQPLEVQMPAQAAIPLRIPPAPLPDADPAYDELIEAQQHAQHNAKKAAAPTAICIRRRPPLPPPRARDKTSR